MKQVDEMPKEGQFVAVWEYNGMVWSDVIRHTCNGLLECCNADGDEWDITSAEFPSKPIFFFLE